MTIAHFQTHQQFNIVGIGLVLTGELLEGTLDYGMQIQLEIDAEIIIYKVTDVQTIEYMNTNTSEVALILELMQGDSGLNYLEQIAGQTIEITSA